MISHSLDWHHILLIVVLHRFCYSCVESYDWLIVNINKILPFPWILSGVPLLLATPFVKSSRFLFDRSFNAPCFVAVCSARRTTIQKLEVGPVSISLFWNCFYSRIGLSRSNMAWLVLPKYWREGQSTRSMYRQCQSSDTDFPDLQYRKMRWVIPLLCQNL